MIAQPTVPPIPEPEAVHIPTWTDIGEGDAGPGPQANRPGVEVGPAGVRCGVRRISTVPTDQPEATYWTASGTRSGCLSLSIARQPAKADRLDQTPGMPDALGTPQDGWFLTRAHSDDARS